MNRRNKIIIAVALLILIGFGFSRSFSEGSEGATIVVDEFFGYVMVDDFDSVESLFHPMMTEDLELEEVLAFLETVNEKIGVATEYKVINTNVKSTVGTYGTRVTVELVYQVSREDFDSTDTFVVIKDNKNPYLIAGFHVSSTGFIMDG